MATEFKLSFTGSEINKKLQKIDTLADKSEIPTKISQLTNDSGYITSYTETDPTVPAWAKAPNKPTYTATEVGALPNTTIIPTVPTNISAFTNDAGYLTQHQSLDGLATEGYVDEKILAIPTPDVSGQINIHNTDENAHNDIRESINNQKPFIANYGVATYQEVYAAVNAGRIVQAKDDNEIIHNLVTINDEGAIFVQTDGQTVLALILMQDNQWNSIQIPLPIAENYYDKTEIDAYLENKSDTSHNHDDLYTTNEQIQSIFGGLANELSEKANVSHRHSISDLDQDTAFIGFFAKFLQKTDVVDNLTTSSLSYPLSANQGKKLKELIDAIVVPTKVSELANDQGYLTSFTESDPTVPAWAKAASKPTYTASEVGALSADDVSSVINSHNTSTDAHNDIRLLIIELTNRLNVLANSDDTTLDQMSEVVAYIKSNRSLIESVTTNKVNVSDIIDNLTTNVTNKPLSAAQGVVLKGLIDALNTNLANYQPKGDYALKSEIPAVPVKSVNGKTGEVSLSASDVGALPTTTKIPAKTSDLTNDSGFITGYTETDPTVPSWAKASSKPTYTKSEVGLGNVDNTSDANKPVSTAQATAIADAKKAGTDAQSNLTTHTSNKSNPHGVTKAQVGLSNVDNVKQYSVDNPPIVVQTTAPTDTSVIWVDPSDNYVSEFSDAVELALAQAKSSGEFDGKTPVKGVDYFTAADQESLIQQILTVMGMHIVGMVDSNNNIVLTGKLTDGLYTFKYEDEEGKTTVIGTVDTRSDTDDEADYINLADPTSEAWVVDKRLNSSAELADTIGCRTTNFFSCVKGDVIRVKGLDIRYVDSEYTQYARAFFYNADGYPIVATYPVSEPKIAFDGIDTFTIILYGLTNLSGGSEEDVVRGRLSGRLFDGYTDEDVIITVNQEIDDSDKPTYTNQIPISTDENGNILNGVGYVEGYRIDSSGALSAASGISTTGYIPCKNGDVLRGSAGIIGDNTGWTGIALYDANKTWVASIKQEILATSSKWVVNEDGSFYLDTTAAPVAQYGEFSYIRFHSQHISDAGMVITVNQPITEEETVYTNWIPLSTEVDGVTLYNGGLGYKENTRWSASGGGDVTDSGRFTCGYIPVSYGDVIRLKNIRMNINDSNSGIANTCTVPVFTELGSGSAVNDSDLTSYWSAVWDDEGNLIQFTINNSDVKYIRLNAAYIGPDSILTINEKITDSEEEPAYTNQIPLSINADGTLYNGGQGWKTGYRLNSTAIESANEGMEVTGFIPVKQGDVVRFANIEWPVNSGVSANKCYVWLYTSGFDSATTNSTDNGCCIREIDGRLASIVGTDSDNNLTEFEMDSNIFNTVKNWDEVAYMRVAAYEITDDSIITINEPIV